MTPDSPLCEACGAALDFGFQESSTTERPLIRGGNSQTADHEYADHLLPHFCW